MKSKPELKVKYVIIPIEISFDKNLTRADAHVWWVINCLDTTKDHCYASNKFIAKEARMKNPVSVSRSIGKLIKCGYVTELKNDSTGRVLKVNTNYKGVNQIVNVGVNKIVKVGKLNSKESYYSIDNTRKHFSLSKDKECFPPENSSKSIDQTELDYNEKVQRLFNYWQELNIVRHRKEKIKIKALDKLNRFSKRYLERDIKQAMDLYKVLLTEPNTIMENRSPFKVGLNEFFGFNKFTDEVINKRYKQLQEIKSWFHVCLEGKEKAIRRVSIYSTDKYPTITERFKELYSEKIETIKEVPINENSFRKAAKRLVKFHEENNDNLLLDRIDKRFAIRFVRFAVNYLRTMNSKNIHPGWFCTDHFWEGFEKWLKQNGYMRK